MSRGTVNAPGRMTCGDHHTLDPRVRGTETPAQWCTHDSLQLSRELATKKGQGPAASPCPGSTACPSQQPGGPALGSSKMSPGMSVDGGGATGRQCSLQLPKR